MDSPASPSRRFGTRRRVIVVLLAVVVAVVVFGTGHKGSELALSAACPSTPVATTAPVATSPVATTPDLSIPDAPTTPVADGSLAIPAAASPVGGAVTTTPAATTPAPSTPDSKAERCRAQNAAATTPLTGVPGDHDAPTYSNLAGTALRDGTLRGRKSLMFDAADPGSGVWQVQITLGPTNVLPRETVDVNNGRCTGLASATVTPDIPKDEDTAPTTTTPLVAPGTAATTTTPIHSGCKKTLHVKVPVDTTQVDNGPQFLTATMWDAAGNATVLLSREVTVTNTVKAKAPANVKTYTIKSVPNSEDQLADTATTPIDSADGDSGQAASTTKKSQATPALPDSARPTPPTIASDTILGRLEAAMNLLGQAQLPYCWGGGHATSPAVPSSGSYCWIGNPAQRVSAPNAAGLDCSSSVSWVLQAVGYPIPTMTSGQFAQLGEPGPGKQMTIWANSTHVYLQVEILGHSYFWGTSVENFEHGPNWHQPRSGAGFTARHLPGL